MRKWLPPLVLWLLSAGLWLAVAVDRSAAGAGETVTIVNEPAGMRTVAAPDTTPRQPAADSCINVNRAGAEQLDALPGVGPVIARRIIDYREAHGPFRRLADMERVKGIGPATVKKIGKMVCF